MKNQAVLPIKTLSQYYALGGLGIPRHPLISVYQFEKSPKIDVEANVRFSLGFYVITLKYDCGCKAQYGQTSFDYNEGVMGYFAPNQVMGIDKNYPVPTRGWCLTIHPDFLLSYELANKISTYQFFHYQVSEALILSEEEEQYMEETFQKIKQELDRPLDGFSQDVLVAQLDLLLTYSNRYYTRQFITRKPLNHQILAKFERLLAAYFSTSIGWAGLPKVSYFADQLHLSSKYFSDLIKQLTGLTAQQHIHERLIQKAKERLSSSSLSISEIAFALGFEHAQSFSKLFKAKTKQSPIEFRQSLN